MSTPLCADRCELVASLVQQIARLRGVPERVVRVGLGLTPEHVPPTPPRTPAQVVVTHALVAAGIVSDPPEPHAVWVCEACGHEYTSRLAARECADFDYQR